MSDTNTNKKQNGFTKKIKDLFAYPVSGFGYILGGGATPGGVGVKAIPDQNGVRYLQPKGTEAPTLRQDRTTGYSQISNVSQNFTMEKVQAACRAAEAGDTRELFTFYRDFFIGSGIIVESISKRKLSTLSEKYSILPIDKNNPDDVYAAKVVEEILNNTPNLIGSMTHLLNAIIYPVAVCEKIYGSPAELGWRENKYNLTYGLKGLYPVDYNVVTYKLPYVPQFAGHSMIIGNELVPAAPPMVPFSPVGEPSDVVYDPDSWEPDLRFWPVLPNGTVVQVPAMLIPPDKQRHLIYRCSLLNGIARENFGGLGKSLLFLAIMSQLGVQVFLQCLQKYGLPIAIAKVDMSQVDTVNQITEAFGQMDILRSIAVNKDAEIVLQEMNYAGAAEAHDIFINFINDQISRLLCGESLSTGKSTGGLGNGKESLQSSVRDDIISYDRLCLAECLEQQVFKYLLEYNGIKGSIPKIVWQGSPNKNENKIISETLKNLKDCGYELTADSFEKISEQFGYKLQRINDSENKIGNNNNKIDDNSDIDKINEDKKDI